VLAVFHPFYTFKELERGKAEALRQKVGSQNQKPLFMKARFLTLLLGICSFALMSSTTPTANRALQIPVAKPEAKFTPVPVEVNSTAAPTWERVYQEIEAKKGEKLSFREKLALKLLKKKMEKKMNAGDKKAPKEIDIIGFVLGLLLGLIGVLLAYLIDRDKYIPSAWYGLLVLVGVIVLLVILAAL
jgi:hypothetical protein